MCNSIISEQTPRVKFDWLFPILYFMYKVMLRIWHKKVCLIIKLLLYIYATLKSRYFTIFISLRVEETFDQVANERTSRCVSFLISGNESGECEIGESLKTKTHSGGAEISFRAVTVTYAILPRSFLFRPLYPWSVLLRDQREITEIRGNW